MVLLAPLALGLGLWPLRLGALGSKVQSPKSKRILTSRPHQLET
jgi:hypothetical protein